MNLKHYAILALIGISVASALADSNDPSKNNTDFFSQLLDPSSNDFQDPTSRKDLVEPITEKIAVENFSVAYHQLPVASSEHPQADSGLTALQNGFISYIHRTDFETLAQELTSSRYASQVHPKWRKEIYEGRNVSILADFIGDTLLKSLADTKEVPGASLSQQDKLFFYLSNNDAILVSPDLERTTKNGTIYLGKLCIGAAERLASQFSSSTNFTLTREDFYHALEIQSQIIRSTSGVTLDKELFDNRMPELQDISIALSVSNNLHELFSGNLPPKTAQYGPVGNMDPAGSYPTAEELRAIGLHETKSPSDLFHSLQKQHPNITIIDYSAQETLEKVFMNNLEHTVISDALAKNPSEYNTMILIGKEDEGVKKWISCVITKKGQDVNVIITDPLNKERLQDASIMRIKQAVKDGLLKKITLPKQDDPFLDDLFPSDGPVKKKGDVKNDKEAVNYDAPLAHIPLEELPSLEDLFGSKVPNTIKVRMKQLEQRELDKNPASARLKNCIILYGPPGTGKSTTAQVMARMAGRNIVYAGGGDFRTAYQGSGKAKLDALFAEAKKRGFCVVLIDEIDGTTSKLQPNGSTQEDNRAIKALITTLDQHRHDPDIFVICTTNYPDKIDPAILRRFNCIEIPLPAYENRKRIMHNFCAQLNIPIETRNTHAISPSFFDRLVSATEGFSGDKIIDMLVNAKYELDAGLSAESSISLAWRLWEGFNWRKKSIISNLMQALLFVPTIGFHLMPDSEMDKHVYTQYRKHVQQLDDLEELEWKNDPRNMNHKYGWARYLKIMGREGFKSIVHGVFTGIGSSLATAVINRGSQVNYAGAVGNYLPDFNIFGRAAHHDAPPAAAEEGVEALVEAAAE